MKQFIILSELFRGCEGFLEIRMINSTTTKRMFIPLEELETVSPNKIISINEQGYNAYFGVCPRNNNKRGKKEHVKQIPALWADIDAKDHGNSMEESYRLATSLPPGFEPSIITNSGNGFHLYWLLKQPFGIFNDAQLHFIENLNEKLATYVGGDTVKDISRILRLPKTINTKNPQDLKICECVLFEPSRRYAAAELDKISLPEKQANAEPEKQTPKKERWIAKTLWGVGEGKRHQTGIRLAGYLKNLHPKDITNTLLVLWGQRCSPPMDKGESEKIVEDIYLMESKKETLSAKIERIRAVKTDPPYYVIYTDKGTKFPISNDDITSFPKFSKVFFANTFNFPDWTNQKTWGRQLVELMANAEIEEAPEEASKDEMLFDIISQKVFYETKEAENGAAFRTGRIIRRDGLVFFHMQPLMGYLRDKLKGNFPYNPDCLYRVIKEHDGGSRTISIQGEKIKSWYLAEDNESNPK